MWESPGGRNPSAARLRQDVACWIKRRKLFRGRSTSRIVVPVASFFPLREELGGFDLLFLTFPNAINFVECISVLT